jgi:hypothetical protein
MRLVLDKGEAFDEGIAPIKSSTAKISRRRGSSAFSPRPKYTTRPARLPTNPTSRTSAISPRPKYTTRPAGLPTNPTFPACTV